jgi:hypothetical protein
MDTTINIISAAASVLSLLLTIVAMLTRRR